MSVFTSRYMAFRRLAQWEGPSFVSAICIKLGYVVVNILERGVRRLLAASDAKQRLHRSPQAMGRMPALVRFLEGESRPPAISPL